MRVRTRFAPSPTGWLHIGGLRTALYAYAFAKSHGGRFILRIEDTDLKRVVPGATDCIYRMLRIFGLNWDEGPQKGGPYGPYVQSERAKIGLYQKYADKLLKNGQAYYCCCPEIKHQKTERGAKREIKLRDECRYLDPGKTQAKIKAGQKVAIRLRVPDNETVSFRDFILKKKISWETKNVDEVMLLKSNGLPTYHLAAMIDDYEMKTSHIIRGRDWLPSTPAHLLLFRYLGLKRPEIGHLTDILDPEGGKLSKRKGSVACEDFLSGGYLPEAVLNFVMLLGWAPKNDREFFTLEEFVKEFRKGELHAANPVFNRRKLDWFNGVYLRKKSNQELLQLIKPYAPQGMNSELVEKILPLVKERLQKLSDFSDLTDFFLKEPEVNPDLLVQKGKTGPETKAVLKQIADLLAEEKNWRAADLEKTARSYCDSTADWTTSQFFMTLRVAVTGKTATPPLFETLAVLGRKKSLQRIKKAAAV